MRSLINNPMDVMERPPPRPALAPSCDRLLNVNDLYIPACGARNVFSKRRGYGIVARRDATTVFQSPHCGCLTQQDELSSTIEIMQKAFYQGSVVTPTESMQVAYCTFSSVSTPALASFENKFCVLVAQKVAICERRRSKLLSHRSSSSSSNKNHATTNQ